MGDYLIIVPGSCGNTSGLWSCECRAHRSAVTANESVCAGCLAQEDARVEMMKDSLKKAQANQVEQ